jgi:hypothetical protein
LNRNRSRPRRGITSVDIAYIVAMISIAILIIGNSAYNASRTKELVPWSPPHEVWTLDRDGIRYTLVTINPHNSSPYSPMHTVLLRTDKFSPERKANDADQP